MNKTIIINISGIIFHIEEDAYEILKSYMNELKKHFSASEDSFEIITDIENRIAEMFSAVLREDKQVIVAADVDSVITQMGRASDFSTEEEAETYTEPSRPAYKKRLFRNPDDRIIGGVCGGIAAYFNTDAIWIRIAVVMLFFMFGFGVILYPVLWIIMPMAQTRAEKLAMRGEQVNISTIKRSVEEEEIKKSSGATGTDRFIGFVRNFFDYLFRFIGKVFRSLGKIAGGLFTLFGGLGTLAMITGGFALFEVMKTDMAADFPFNVVEASLQNWLLICLLLSALIPMIALLLIGLKLLFNVKAFTRTSGFILLGLWIIFIGISVFMITKTATDFREQANLRETEQLNLSANRVYHIRMNDDYRFSQKDDVHLRIKAGVDHEKGKHLLQFSGNQFIGIHFPSLRIESTKSNIPTLTKDYSARGKDFQSALEAAKEITYTYEQQDSVILFDWIYQMPEGRLYRAQEVDLTLKLPVGSKIVIDNSNHHVEQILDNVWLYSCADYEEEQVQFVMTEEGLECLNKREEENE